VDRAVQLLLKEKLAASRYGTDDWIRDIVKEFERKVSPPCSVLGISTKIRCRRSAFLTALRCPTSSPSVNLETMTGLEALSRVNYL